MPSLGIPDNIALINGPMLLGYLFSYLFLGVLCVQIFFYHTNFPQDPGWIKSLVWGLFSWDIIITVLETIAAWHSFASAWGDVSSLEALYWPFAALPALTALAASVVHFFFAWRIWKLKKWLIITVPIWTTSVVQFATAAYVGISVYIMADLSKINSANVYTSIWLGGSALCDVIITAAMIHILLRANSRARFRNTKSVLSKLMTFTIETGMLTACCALVELVFFIAFPHNNMHFIIFLMLAKLYSNTLVAALNARALIGSRSLQDSGNAPVTAFWDDTRPRPPGSPLPAILAETDRHISRNNIELVVMSEGDDDFPKSESYKKMDDQDHGVPR